MDEHSRTPVAIITGCSSGIGRATAVLLAEHGWRVFATARHPETLSDIASDCIIPLRLDVTDEASMVSGVERALAQAGRIDALVNNAGYAEVGPLEEVDADGIRRQFETNTFGPLRLAQLVIPTMRGQRSGRIVNVSTMGGRIASPFRGLYNSSKFALEALSDVLRMETRPFGVHVIVIEPGAVQTNFISVVTEGAQRFATDPNSPCQRYFERLNNFVSQAAARGSPPETVAKVILRALTDRPPHARYIATPDARLMLAIVPRLPEGMRDAVLSWMAGLRESRTA